MEFRHRNVVFRAGDEESRLGDMVVLRGDAGVVGEVDVGEHGFVPVERRTKRTPVAGGEEAGMGFEFRGCDEGREGASSARCDPSMRGAIRTEGGFDLLGVARELEGEEGIDVTVYELHCLGVVEEFPVAKERIAYLRFALGVDVVDGESTSGW